MAITPVGTYPAANNALASTTATISTDTSVQAGDILYAEVSIPNTSVTITPPTDWTEIVVSENTASTSVQKRLYWHEATAGSQSYIWTFSSGQRWSGFIRALRGVDTGAPVDVADQAADNPSTSHTGPQVTTSGDGRWIVTGWVYETGAPLPDRWTAGAGLTELGEAQGGNATLNVALMLADATANPVATGAYQFSATSAGNARSLMSIVALKPAAASGSTVDLTPATFTLVGVALDPVPGPAEVTLTPATLTLAGQPVDAVPGPVTVDLTPAALDLSAVVLDPVPGPVTVHLVPTALTLTAVPLDPSTAGAEVALTPAGMTFTAIPLDPVPRPGSVQLIPIVMTFSAIPVTIPEDIIRRPNTGTVARPDAGTVPRPAAGTVLRPNTGSIARPDTGTVARP